MFNCPKCWDKPCSCGYEYRGKSDEEMAAFIYGITKRYHNPEAVLAEFKRLIVDKNVEYVHCPRCYRPQKYQEGASYQCSCGCDFEVFK